MDRPRIIVDVACNALAPKADVGSQLTQHRFRLVRFFFLFIRFVTSIFGKSYGGLWVGGRFQVDGSRAQFTPNVVNRWIHNDHTSFSFPLNELKAAKRQFGFITGVVLLRTDQREYKIRCFGAKQIANELQHFLDDVDAGE